MQRTKDFLRKFHRDGRHGNTAALDIRLTATVLGDVKCALKYPVQPRAGVAVAMRERVSLLELAEDFRFAEHHRVEAARDSEKMVQTLRSGEGIK